MLDIVTRYDIDGIVLDYVRSIYICQTQFCIDDYFAKTTRNLNDDITIGANTNKFPAPFLKWQAAAMEDIIRSFSEQARLIKPNLVISIGGHVAEEIELGPKKVLAAYARNQIDWMQKGLIDVIYDLDYAKVLTNTYIETTRSMVPEPYAITKVLEL